jgi:hypothetical protein
VRQPCVHAVVSGPALGTPVRDDTQSSAAVASSRLVSAVGASMSDGAVRRPARRGTGGLSRDRRALWLSPPRLGKGATSERFELHDAPLEVRTVD